MHLLADGTSVELRSEERLTGIAVIFADALQRLKLRRIQTSPDSGNSSPAGLELSPETVLSVHTG